MPRSRMRNTRGGETVEVEGGHIVRSTGRKDRHSKVCTAKGPRERRVRLAAHTAIQFYDVQDRLGYDRPSKAVDWLIKKAKSAIDELDQLPAWHPQQENSSFLDSDAIADTIKSLAEASNNQDLRLSLHSFQDPISSHSEPQVVLSWPEHQELGCWSGGGDTLQPVPVPMPMPMLLGQNQFVSQRGPLQSSNTPSIRAWPSTFAAFHIPARIQGDDEEPPSQSRH